MGNAAEVDLAVSLLRKLRASLPAGALRGRVAVVSPYREQRDALRAALRRELGEAAAAAEVAVDTIDGFQGQERDVVIFSAVRAGQGGAGVRACGLGRGRVVWLAQFLPMGCSAPCGGVCGLSEVGRGVTPRVRAAQGLSARRWAS